MWLIIISVIVLLGALAVLGMGLRMPGLMLLAAGLAALVLGFLVLIGQNRPDDAENRDQGGQIYYLNSGVTAERDPYRSAVATRDDTRLAQWSDAHAADELSLKQARSIGLAIIDQSDVLSQERGADAPYGGDLLQKLIRDGIITTEDLAGASAMSGSLCILPQRSRVAGGVDISIKHETEWLSGQGNSSVVPDAWADGALSDEDGPYIEFRWKEITVDGQPLDIAGATSGNADTMDDLYERELLLSSRVRPFGARPMKQIVSFPFVDDVDASREIFTPGPHLFAVKAEVIWFDGRNDNASVVAVVPLEATRILSVRPTPGVTAESTKPAG